MRSVTSLKGMSLSGIDKLCAEHSITNADAFKNMYKMYESLSPEERELILQGFDSVCKNAMTLRDNIRTQLDVKKDDRRFSELRDQQRLAALKLILSA